MRVLFVLPGLHRFARGAEVALTSVACELANSGDRVTLIGSGQPRPSVPYRYLRVPCVSREHFESFPTMPGLRDECAYEELTFAPGLFCKYRPEDYDVTVACSYPATNWLLRRAVWGKRRPPHVFVTQNGDWPAYARNAEFRLFGCEGLVCTNPDFYERNKSRWRCQLIPNGVDCTRFAPGPQERQQFGLPADRLVVLMVSALITSKRVEAGIEAVSRIRDAHLVVAGDGPLRQSADALAARLMPNRFTRLSLASEQMPTLYRSADVFLHLSKEESFGNVFLEAMASSIPIVAHDSPRLRWILGDAETLLDTSDLAAVAQHIGFASKQPAARREAQSARAAAFSWPRIGEQYRRFLSEVVTSGSDQRSKSAIVGAPPNIS